MIWWAFWFSSNRHWAVWCWGYMRMSVWVCSCVLTCTDALSAHGCMLVIWEKSYWWIIALTRVTDAITGLCLALPLPSSPVLILCSTTSSLMFYYTETNTHTKHWKTCSKSSCLTGPTCELWGWCACQSGVVLRCLWLLKTEDSFPNTFPKG